MRNSILNKSYVHILLITVLGLLIYSNTFDSPFIFDDVRYIVDNPAVQDMQYFHDPSKVATLKILPELRHAFRTRIFGHFTFALNYKLNGLDVTGYHIFNFIVHIVNALLVYWLVLLTFRTPFFLDRTGGKGAFSPAEGRFIIALFSALLFVCHPVQTQAITYITQRFASLATMFYMLTMAAYIKARISETNAARYVSYIIALGSTVLAMLTKEISFTLPLVIALYEVMFFDGKMKKRVMYLIPFFLTMSIIPLSLLAAASSGDIGESMRKLAISHGVSRWEYLITQFRVIVTYARLLLFPVNQNLYYDYPVFRSIFNPQVLLSFLFVLIVFLSAGYFFYRSRETSSGSGHLLRLISFGISWSIITLSMESSIIPIKDVIFEHRLYLPSAGIFIAFSTAFLMTMKRLIVSAASHERTAVIILLIIVVVLSGTAYARNSVWRSEISLWEDVVSKSPEMDYNHTELALAYEKQGRTGDAVKSYLNAIKVNPENTIAHNNLGLAYTRQGRIEEAIREYRLAIKSHPDYYKAHINLGVTYFTLGRTEDAVKAYSAAIKIYPGFDIARFNLGLAYYTLGRTEDAIREFSEAIKINPDFHEAHYRLGLAYIAQGRFDEASKAFRTVLRLAPDNSAARTNLENIVRMKKRAALS